MVSEKTQGFTLIEMMVALSVFLIATAITFVSLLPAWKDSRVTSAYNTTLMTMRRAHDAAATSRRVYVVSFDNTVSPNTVTVSQNDTLSNGGILLIQSQLPPDLTFRVEPGIPTTTNGACPTPDGFGTGNKAIDFNQGSGGGGATTVYFYPDGSAHDQASNGAINNGVVYLARQGELYTSRAITLWGATGRIRGWRLYAASGSGTNCWRPQ